MTRTAIYSALLALGAGLVHGLSISQQCQNALLTIAGSPEASCLNVGGLIPLVTTNPNSSYVPAINSWLGTLCAADPCSNQTLADIVANVTTGCSSDLGSLGVPSNINQTVIDDVQAGYPTVRKIACLKQSNNTLCATQTLSNLEGVTGPLSLDNLFQLVPSLLTGQASVSLPQSLACTDCLQAAYDIVKTDQPSIASNPTVTNAIQSQCGASFLSNSAPTNILEGTGSAAPTGSGSANGAVTLFSQSALIGVSFSSLAVVFSGFFILA